MNNTSNWTGRTHRTLDSAFGPYTSNDIEAANDPQERRWKWADRAVYAIGVGVLMFVLAGWLRS